MSNLDVFTGKPWHQAGCIFVLINMLCGPSSEQSDRSKKRLPMVEQLNRVSIVKKFSNIDFKLDICGSNANRKAKHDLIADDKRKNLEFFGEILKEFESSQTFTLNYDDLLFLNYNHIFSKTFMPWKNLNRNFPLIGGEDLEDSSAPVPETASVETIKPEIVETQGTIKIASAAAVVKEVKMISSILGCDYSPADIWKQDLCATFEARDAYKGILTGDFYSGDKILLQVEPFIEPISEYLDDLVGIVSMRLSRGVWSWDYNPVFYFSDENFLKHHKEPRLEESLKLDLYTGYDDMFIVKSLPATKTYALSLNADMLSKMASGHNEIKESKYFYNLLGVRDIEAQTYVRSVLDNHRVGDNHLTFFVRGWLYWLGACVAVNSDGDIVRTKDFPSTKYKSVLNLSELAAELRSGFNQVVWVSDPDINFVHFMTTLCSNGPPVYSYYYRENPEDIRYIAYDSLVSFETQRELLCVGNFEHHLEGLNPTWGLDPDMIKSYLIRYATSLGIAEQLFDAMKIAYFTTNFLKLGVTLRCPEPLHTSDLFYWVNEPKEIDSSFFSLNQYAGIKHKLIPDLMMKMLQCGFNDFKESILSNRLNVFLDRDDFTQYTQMFSINKYILEKMEIGFINKILGYDFSFMIHFDMHRGVHNLFKLPETFKSNSHALIRILVPSYPKNTMTSLLRGYHKLTFADIASRVSLPTYDEKRVLDMVSMLDDGIRLNVLNCDWYFPMPLRDRYQIPPTKREIWLHLRAKNLSLQLADLLTDEPVSYVSRDRYYDSVKSKGKVYYDQVSSLEDQLIVADIGVKHQRLRDTKQVTRYVKATPTKSEVNEALAEHGIKKPSELSKEPVLTDVKRKEQLGKIKKVVEMRKLDRIDEQAQEEEREKKSFLDIVKEAKDISDDKLSQMELEIQTLLGKSPSLEYSKMLALNEEFDRRGIKTDKVNWDKLLKMAKEFFKNMEPKSEGKVPMSNKEKERVLIGHKKLLKVRPILPYTSPSERETCLRFFIKTEWEPFDCGGGGDCGPNTGAFCLNRYLGKSKTSSISLRNQISAFFSQKSKRGEWWDEIDFLALACIYKVGLAVRSSFGWEIPVAGDNWIVIEHLNGNHWRALLPKEKKVKFPKIKVSLDRKETKGTTKDIKQDKPLVIPEVKKQISTPQIGKQVVEEGKLQASLKKQKVKTTEVDIVTIESTKGGKLIKQMTRPARIDGCFEPLRVAKSYKSNRQWVGKQCSILDILYIVEKNEFNKFSNQDKKTIAEIICSALLLSEDELNQLKPVFIKLATRDQRGKKIFVKFPLQSSKDVTKDVVKHGMSFKVENKFDALILSDSGSDVEDIKTEIVLDVKDVKPEAVIEKLDIPSTVKAKKKHKQEEKKRIQSAKAAKKALKTGILKDTDRIEEVNKINNPDLVNIVHDCFKLLNKGCSYHKDINVPKIVKQLSGLSIFYNDGFERDMVLGCSAIIGTALYLDAYELNWFDPVLNNKLTIKEFNALAGDPKFKWVQQKIPSSVLLSNEDWVKSSLLVKGILLSSNYEDEYKAFIHWKDATFKPSVSEQNVGHDLYTEMMDVKSDVSASQSTKSYLLGKANILRNEWLIKDNHHYVSGIRKMTSKAMRSKRIQGKYIEKVALFITGKSADIKRHTDLVKGHRNIDIQQAYDELHSSVVQPKPLIGEGGGDK